MHLMWIFRCLLWVRITIAAPSALSPTLLREQGPGARDAPCPCGVGPRFL